MKLKHALKKKNLLAGEIRKEYAKLIKYNTVNVVNEKNRPYSAVQTMETIKQLTEELIELKVRIQQTNIPVLDKIYRLSELKAMIVNVNELTCESGKLEDHYRADKFVVSEISIQERDKMLRTLSDEIDKLHDQLDYFNQVTDLAA